MACSSIVETTLNRLHENDSSLRFLFIGPTPQNREVIPLKSGAPFLRCLRQYLNGSIPKPDLIKHLSTLFDIGDPVFIDFINENEVVNFDQLCPALTTNTSLHHLAITRLLISDVHIAKLSQWIASNTGLITLSLNEHIIFSPGGGKIAESLQTNTTLTCLDLSYNAIGKEDALAFGKSLQNNSTLNTLNLSGNYLDEEGCRVIAESLQTNSTLTTLYLSRNSVMNAGAMAVGELLRTNSTLTSLDLSSNSVHKEGGIALGESLRTNSSLIDLTLNTNSVTNEGCMAIGESLQTNSTLTYLDLSDNAVEIEGAMPIGESLRINSTLTYLNLADNSIQDEGATMIGKALRTNSTLIDLDLSDNNITFLSPSFALCVSLKHLQIKDNPLVDPPLEFIKSSNFSEIMPYLLAKRSDIARLKLLIVGYEATGKTYLANALVSRPTFPSFAELKSHMAHPNGPNRGMTDKSTHGIHVSLWNTDNEPPLIFTIFDFGGQPIYYTNHRHFLGQYESAYLVVFDIRWDIDQAIRMVRHWLNLIASQIDKQWHELFRHGTLSKPTVVFVGTHCDQSSALQRSNHTWHRRISQEFNTVFSFAADIQFINHNDPSTIEKLRTILVDCGKVQSAKLPRGLYLIEELLESFRAIRSVDSPLFHPLDDLQSRINQLSSTSTLSSSSSTSPSSSASLLTSLPSSSLPLSSSSISSYSSSFLCSMQDPSLEELKIEIKCCLCDFVCLLDESGTVADHPCHSSSLLSSLSSSSSLPPSTSILISQTAPLSSFSSSSPSTISPPFNDANAQNPFPASSDPTSLNADQVARLLQAQGEAVYLSRYAHICYDPQRLFDLLAEIVQQDQKSERNKDKKFIENTGGIVTYAAIQVVCFNRCVEAEHLLAAMLMLDLCVEISASASHRLFFWFLLYFLLFNLLLTPTPIQLLSSIKIHFVFNGNWITLNQMC